MKPIERIVLGLSAAIAMTAVILLSLDIFESAGKSSRLEAVLTTEAETGSDTDASGENDADSETKASSAGSDKDRSTYQAQGAAALDSKTAGQPRFDSQQPDSQTYTAVRPDGQAGLNDEEPDDEASDTPANITIKLQKNQDASTQAQQADADTAKKSQAADSSASDQTQAASASNKKQAASASAASQNSASAGSQNAQTDTAAQQAGASIDRSFHTVTEDYFSDAVFIGDSRTVGLQQSGLLPNAAYYAKTGIGIRGILTKNIVKEGDAMISVEEALRRHTFGKVYIMIGINDMSAGNASWFKKQYAKIIQTVRSTQPDAVIYIQGNIPMSRSTQDMNGSLNNKNLTLRNEASRSLADETNIFYLDISHIYADADGSLSDAYTKDGLHITAKYNYLWADYLMHHAVIR